MTIESLKEEARRHEQQEEWIKALDLYMKAIDRQSSDDEPDIALYNRVGDLQVRLGDVPGAVENYETAIQLYRDSELPNNAIAVCRKIIRHAPQRPSPFLRMGQIRAGQGFLVDARQNFLTYAEMKQAAGETDEAFRALEEFARLAPRDAEIRVFLAEQLLPRERNEDALGYLEQAYRILGAAEEMEGAEEVLQRIWEIDPDHPVPSMAPEPKVEAEPKIVTNEAGPDGAAVEEAADELAGFESTSLGAEVESLEEPEPEEAPDGVERSEAAELTLDEEDDSRESDWEGAGREIEGLEQQAADIGGEQGADEEAEPLETDHPGWLETDQPEFSEEIAAAGDADLLGGGSFMEGAGLPGDDEPDDEDEYPGELAGDADLAGDLEASDSLDLTEEPQTTDDSVFGTDEFDFELADETTDDDDEDVEPLPLLDGDEEEPELAASEESGWADAGADDEEPEPLEPTVAERAFEEAASEAAADEQEDETWVVEGEETFDLEEEDLEAEAEALDFEEGALELGGEELELDPLDEAAGNAAPTDRVQELRERVRREPGDAEGWRHLGDALYEGGDEDGGRAALERSHEAYAESGDAEKAMRVVRELLLREPDRLDLRQRVVEYAHRTNERTLLIQAFLELGDGLRAAGEAQKADAVYQQVLSLDPSNMRASEALGRQLPGRPAGAGDRDRGRDFVDLGSMVLDADGQRTTRWVVPAELPSGDEEADFSKMLSQFKQKVAENIASDDVKSHYDLGTAFKEMGLLDEAIGEFQQALRAQPRSLPTFEMLGQCFLENGSPEVAIRTLERGTRLPTPVEDDLLGIYYFLARAHEEVGNTDAAREFYEKVFSLDINFKDVTDRLRTLR